MGERRRDFKVVKSEDDDIEYLELMTWNPNWAITELEKKVLVETEALVHCPGMLSLAFPLKFPADYKKVYKHAAKIDHFQKRSYLSPHADARGLKSEGREFYKRAIAVMHEVLSFTIDKRLVTDHLTHFRWEFMMPQKLMRVLLRHFGIFYVSERGKRFSVFLTEAYQGSELIQKNPFVVWREKVDRLIGYRGKKKHIETFSDLSDNENYNLYESDSGDGNISSDAVQEEMMDGFADGSVSDMEIEDICSAYNGADTENKNKAQVSTL